MHVEKFCYNSDDDLAANTYVVNDDKLNAVIIDPSVDYDGIINYLEKNHLSPRCILLTHAHYDHIKGVTRLANRYKISTFLHVKEVETLKNPRLNCSYWEEPLSVDVETSLLKGGETLKQVIDDEIIVIDTPFHTEGSVCYYFKNNKLLFSGDTLFKLSIGRDDLPTSVPEFRKASLNRIKALPKETKVFPGHGNNTTIEYELSFNHFLNQQ